MKENFEPQNHRQQYEALEQKVAEISKEISGEKSDVELLNLLTERKAALADLEKEYVAAEQTPHADNIEIDSLKTLLNKARETVNGLEQSIGSITGTNSSTTEQIEKVHLIDTTTQPQIPSWATASREHNTSLGTIEWNKEKFKEGGLRYMSEFSTIDKILKKIREEKVPVLNATVLDYLLAHQDQIPENWKSTKSHSPRQIYFWGTLFTDGRTSFVQYIQFREDKGLWVADSDAITDIDVRGNEIEYSAVLPSNS